MNPFPNDQPFVSRRDFLRQSACKALGLGGMISAITDLRLINSAAAQTTSGDDDYKALVCLFLNGGNDASNCIVPRGPAYTGYADTRGILAIPESDLRPIDTTGGDGRLWGLHPRLGSDVSGVTTLHSLYESGKMALLGNVGTLVAPTNQAQYLSGGVEVPPQLFSHKDQQIHWQSSVPDKPFSSGWGGRIADILHPGNIADGAEISMSISLAGTNNFLVGATDAAVQYRVTPAGAIGLNGYGFAKNDSGDYRNNAQGVRLRAFDEIMSQSRSNLFEESYRGSVERARENQAFLSEALDGLELPADFPDFPQTTLGDQLKMVANLLAVRDSLKHKRQVFFVQISGWDNHASLLPAHEQLLLELSEAVGAFYDATVSLGIDNQVTSFTNSDFGRTFSPNGSIETAGADHGWGGHAFIVGGAVQGGQLYGTMPDLSLGGPDDTNLNNARGRWIPTTSVDEYGATLARWFGLSETELEIVFPNLHRFDHPDLGFMA
ncbi:MAG: DUF1501 domain-containing protein [Verrucomicrobiota bacterium]